MSSKRVPKYRKHVASGQAIVTLSGRHIYLGPHGTQASKGEYEKLIALGPRAWVLINPFLKREAEACPFSPREAEDERNALIHASMRSAQ